MTEKKMTKVEKINMILAMAEVQANPVAVEFLTHELELLQNKSANKKATKKQEENEVIKEKILALLKEKAERMTISAITKELPKEELSSQKTTALIKQLIAEGKVVRETEKKVAYFRIAEVAVEGE